MGKYEITIVGCGPGSLDYLTPIAKRVIEQAEVLVGAKRLLELFPDKQTEKIPVGSDIEGILNTIDTLSSQKQVAVLVTGDPGLCSLALPVLKRFGRSRCRVIPGISSIQVAFARIGIDWLDARIINAHYEIPASDPASLAREKKIALLVGQNLHLEWIDRLVKSMKGDYRIYLCENLTLDDEHVRRIKAEELEKLNVSSRSIVLLVQE